MANNGVATFNEANVSKDMSDVLEEANQLRTFFRQTSEEINSKIANASPDDALSGEAGTDVLNQWMAVNNTFEDFFTNFDNWYRAGKAVALTMANTEDEVRNVGLDADDK